MAVPLSTNKPKKPTKQAQGFIVMARFYAACLASYNSGILHGRWIEASSDIDEMQEAVTAMLRSSPCPNVTIKCEECEGNGKPWGFGDSVCEVCKGKGTVPSAEEWAMHDSENLPRYIGEYSGLKPIAEFMELVEENDDWDADDLATIISDLGSVSEAKSALDDKFCGRYDSFKDYAEEAADEALAAHNIKDNNPLYNYFDYDAYARDLRHEMTTVDLSDGKVAIFYA